jgi:glycosyltransferase involved in cell wall biosynthesis
MKKITVTIGIPAYNEEQNIESFLKSIFKQKLDAVDLKEVLVYSDASSDKTNTLVKKLSKTLPSIKLIEGATRKGKYFRVNELFRRNKTDVLVILDADIAFSDKDILEKLVSSLVADKKAAMMASHVDLIRPDKVWPKILHTTFVLGDIIRLSVPGYDVAANFHGAATAYKKSFIETVHIPTNLSDPHLYIYLSAKKINGFRYCPDAAILQIPPSTMKDVEQLMRRSIGKRDMELERIFGEKMLDNLNIFTKREKLLGLWKCFLWQPFYTPIAVFMNFYLGRVARRKKADTSPVWRINTSTKRRIDYAK